MLNTVARKMLVGGGGRTTGRSVWLKGREQEGRQEWRGSGKPTMASGKARMPSDVIKVTLISCGEGMAEVKTRSRATRQESTAVIQMMGPLGGRDTIRSGTKTFSVLHSNCMSQRGRGRVFNEGADV